MRPLTLGILPLGTWGLGNPACWEGDFSYESCCFGPGGNPNCWDQIFTFASCCLESEPKTVTSHYHQTADLGRQSAVFRDKTTAQQLEQQGKFSECQVQWGWGLNLKWGAPIGAYADHSGVPLRHTGYGWDTHKEGNHHSCAEDAGRFFLVEVEIESEPRKHHKMHFGFCAPAACSVQQVTHDLVPEYVIQVADARRLMMTLLSVEAWEWSDFLDTHYVSDLRDITVRQRMDEVSFQIQVFTALVASLVTLATLCDFTSGDTANGKASSKVTAVARHFVEAFSATRAWRELQSPKVSSAVDLLRGLATLLLLSLHFEMAQNGSTDGMLEGGSTLRISLCFRCTIIMTVLALHLALGNDQGVASADISALQRTCGNCSLKLARKFLRQLPLIMISVWWDRTGVLCSFVNQPIRYIDGSLSQVQDGSVLQWTDRYQCKQSYWSCVFQFWTMNWQVRDLNERVLACYSLLLLRAAGVGFAWLTEATLYLSAVAYYGIRDYQSDWLREFDRQNHLVAFRLELPAFLGLFLFCRRLAASLSSRLPGGSAGFWLALGSWLWSSWVNEDDYATHCMMRNVKRMSGDLPFVLGLCLLLQTGPPKEGEKTQKQSSQNLQAGLLSWTLTLISRLSFCMLVVEGPLQVFLMRKDSKGKVPLARGVRADSMWERILFGPGLLLVNTFLAFLLFIMVQRPVEVFLMPLLKFRYLETIFSGLLPIYTAFVVYQAVTFDHTLQLQGGP